MGKPRASEREKVDHNQDRYPDFTTALTRIRDETETPDASVQKIEINFFADGSATYRFWAGREEEAQGGVISPP